MLLESSGFQPLSGRLGLADAADQPAPPPVSMPCRRVTVPLTIASWPLAPCTKRFARGAGRAPSSACRVSASRSMTLRSAFAHLNHATVGHPGWVVSCDCYG